MLWEISHRADKAAAKIADRHYNRQKPGSPQFVPPGRCIVLKTNKAVWVTSWPYAEYVKHEWAGAWINSLFRNESEYLSSMLILQAIAATRYFWPDIPKLGLITFVDTTKIRSINPGYCYKMAGFRQIGRTKGGLITLQLLSDEMPIANSPRKIQLKLF